MKRLADIVQDAKRAAILAALKQHTYDLGAVSIELGVTRAYLSELCRRLNITLRRRGRPHTCSEACLVAGQMFSDGKSISDIAATLALDVGKVRWVLVHHGHQMRGRYDVARVEARRRATVAVEAYRANVPQAEIALRLGISRERVRQILLRAGITPARLPRPHVCTEACSAVLSAPKPLALLPLARAVGIADHVLRRAARAHGLRTRTERTSAAMRHVCSERCAALRAGLESGLSIRQAAVKAGFHPNHVYAHVKVQHPEFPWPEPRWWLRRKPSVTV